MADLIVVVDPNYGDRVEGTAQAAPVWIVATPTNKTACEHLWKERAHPDHRETGAVTCYSVTNPEDRLGGLLNVIPTLETHHGEVKDDQFSFPDGFVLEVIGLALADYVTDALREFSFSSFVETPEGFRARKVENFAPR
jgi:hypothetical protein